MRFAWRFTGATCLAVAWPSSALAEDPALAEALFREGRAELAAGRTAAACEKFKASQAADPSAGTLLNLASCHFSQGKSATAWAEFLSAARLARAQGKTKQEAEATRRAQELEPTLSYLTVVVAEPVPNLEVRRGDALLEPSMFGVRVPVDPGPTTVDASAPGYEAVHQSLVIGASRDERVVRIAKLAPVAPQAPGASPATATATSPTPSAPPTTPDTPVEDRRDGPTASAAPWIVGGIGGALLVGGAVSGILALGSNSSAKERCPEASRCSDSEALDLARRRDTQAMFANVGIGAGVVGVGVAAIWLATRGHEQRADRAILPALSGNTVGVSLWQRF